MTFEGSGPIEKLAEWLFPYIKRSMLTEIERFTCSKLKALVGQNLTEVLQEVNAELVPFMNHAFKVGCFWNETYNSYSQSYL